MYWHDTEKDKGTTPPAAAQPAQQEPVALEAVYETIIHWDEGGGKRSRRELARRIVALCTAPPAAAQPAPVQQPVNQERESLRAAQGEAVMPLIGPLLDAWESCSETMRGEQPEVDKYLRKINRAMEDATPPAAPVQPEQEPVIFYRCNGCGHAYERVPPTSCDCMEAGGFDRVEYYTAPPSAQPVPLNAGEISRLWKRHTNPDGPHHNPYDDDGLGFARAILAAASTPPEAPAQPEQEPVAWTEFDLSLIDGLIYEASCAATVWGGESNPELAGKQKSFHMDRVALLKKIKATPPAAAQRKPLTPEQSAEMWTQVTLEPCTHEAAYLRGIKDTEAAHGIGEKK